MIIEIDKNCMNLWSRNDMWTIVWFIYQVFIPCCNNILLIV